MEFPSFNRGESQKLFNSLPRSEKNIIENYVNYVGITSKSKTRLENNKRNLLTLRRAVDKPLNKITLKDLRNFLSLLNKSKRTQASKNDLKHTTKRFLKWQFKDWSKRFENLADIKLHMKMNEEKINAHTLLNQKDVEAIVKAEPKLFWKAFFLTLYESALRPIELRTLLWRNIKFDVEEGGISEITIYATKTSKARSVYVKEATFYLKKLKEKAQNELVFPAPRNKSIPIDKNLPSVWLGRISQKVLGRKVYPYMLRHSRATELYTNAGIADKTAQKFLGHSKSMGDVYTHLSNKDVKEAVSKTIYKLEDLPPERKHRLEKEIEKLKAQKIEDRILILETLNAVNKGLAGDRKDMEKIIKNLKKQGV